MNPSPKLTRGKPEHVPEIWIWIGIVSGLFAAAMLALLVLQLPVFSQQASFLNDLFSASNQEVMWFITRSAGIVAYLILWLSVAWGLAVPSKILDRLLHRTFTYDFHEFISLLAIGFTLLHMIVLMFDGYMPYSIGQITIPFLSAYRPFWVGIGIIGFYLMVLVAVTFYIRSRIGVKTYRTIHYFSLLAYLLVTLHGFFSGTDTPLVAVTAMYLGTFLITIFLVLYWLYVLSANRQKKNGNPGVKPLTSDSSQTIYAAQNFSEHYRR